MIRPCRHAQLIDDTPDGPVFDPCDPCEQAALEALATNDADEIRHMRNRLRAAGQRGADALDTLLATLEGTA